MIMAELTQVLLAHCLLTITIVQCGVTYPLSGSWFKDRTNDTDVNETLSTFKAVGGDTVLLRGAEFLNRTAESIRADPAFTSCRADGKHCVDIANEEITRKGLNIEAWATYSYDDDYSDKFVVCKGFDKKIAVGKRSYHRIVLWLEQYKAADDCGFINGSRVAVLFTSYSGDGDPHALLLKQAQEKKLTVYMGLPKPPHLRSDDASSRLLQAFFQFNYRIIADHKVRFGNNSALKGYYSDVEVIPDYIIHEQNHTAFNNSLPPSAVLMFWRELSFLTGYFEFGLLASPTLDLTHSGNTTLAGHINALRGITIFAPMVALILRDGRGEGQAAYYREEEKHKAIYDTDYELWEILSAKNTSMTTKTTFTDVYYASLADVFREVKKFTTPWLMIEAYADIPKGTWCEPVDSKKSGMDRKVQSVDKYRLDQALTHVGAVIGKVTAFAWDPMFTCSAPTKTNLAQQIKDDYQRPIISECRFHSASNQSIVVLGYHLEGPVTQPFQVNYTLYDGTRKSTSLFGYYFELDYGKEHGLVDSLVYIQLYDIPELRDLRRKGSIRVARTDGTGDPCVFSYSLDATVS